MPLLVGLECMLMCLFMLGGNVWAHADFSEGHVLGVILALHALDAIHLGVDNLNVVRLVGLLLDGVEPSRPLELENDWDVIALVRKVVGHRGEGTIRISKVKEHADEEMLRQGYVRGLDNEGNQPADDAADFGRRRVGPEVIDARRNLASLLPSPVLWSIMMIVEVQSLTFSYGLLVLFPRGAGLFHAVRNHAMQVVELLSGHLVGSVSASAISAEDVGAWPYSVGILVKWVTFPGTLHWPAVGGDLGVGEVSYVEMLLLY